ncbi:hypothetical protein PUN28_004152 [Cardiocondyla obscurior]|uniref:Uncharacterized protein n=1 Tax=Cardiocondyla obscurior TaxID=286306 RepID=A0AAW2GPT2_9HYME
MERGCTIAILRRPVGHISPCICTPRARGEYTSRYHVKTNRREWVRVGAPRDNRVQPRKNEPKRIDRHRDGYRSGAIGPVCFRVPTRAESWRTLVILSHLWQSGSDGEPSHPAPSLSLPLPPPPPSAPLTAPPRTRSFLLLVPRTRATRELGLHSRFTTSFMVHTVREHAEVPYGQLSPALRAYPGNCIISHKLSRAARACTHVCMRE